MAIRPLSSLPPLPRQSSSAAGNGLALVISIRAVPSARLTREISVVLNRSFHHTHRFLSGIDAPVGMEFRLPDLDQTATEILARRLLKLSDVRKLAAKRVCPRRGTIYAISLQSHACSGSSS